VYDRCTTEAVLKNTNAKTFPNLEMILSNSEFQPLLFDHYPHLLYCQTNLYSKLLFQPNHYSKLLCDETNMIPITDKDIKLYNTYANIVEYEEV
jgi:hypothetical protein